jgi:hypothetical protein
MMDFSDADTDQLNARGISPAEVERQLELFCNPPGCPDLVRSCGIGDGVERIVDAAECEAAFESARAAGRLTKFVPASGAASRMFQALLALRGAVCTLDDLERRVAAGDGAAGVALAFARGVDRLPFAAELRAALRGDDLDAALRDGRWDAVVDAVAGAAGLGYAAIPKGLLPFHAYPDGARTAFEEHLHEAVELVRDDGGRVRAHLTVSPEHLSLFEDALRSARAAIEADGRTRLEVRFSTQAPRTDTVAVDLDNRLVRDRAGRIVFRPGGHGALLENLAGCGADIALVQNIDNIQPVARRLASSRWKRLLIGRLVQLQSRREALCDAGDWAGLRALCETLGLAHAAVSDDDALEEFADRPIRVCGVVRNTGEPGGGPFWVRDRGGSVSRQIIESAEVDPRSEEQQAMFRRSTHFNPVLLACGLRDVGGVPYDLERYVDPRAVFLSHKSVDGVEIVALERPGLWNGSMAHWATVFVEIGGEAFTPVKTVADLLRAEHCGDG